LPATGKHISNPSGILMATVPLRTFTRVELWSCEKHIPFLLDEFEVLFCKPLGFCQMLDGHCSLL
jgi:hypothetical protein